NEGCQLRERASAGTQVRRRDHMELPIIVDIVDRRGRAKERHRVAQLPATIGRSYGCDVILEDPFVPAVGLRLEMDEHEQVIAIQLANDRTTNAPARAVRVHPELTLTLGETALRLRTADYPIAETLSPRTTDGGWLGISTTWLASIAWLAVVG